MIAQFSPLTRRVLALGILVLALFGAVNLVLMPLYGLTAGSLSGLEDARFQRARLEAIAARPPLPRSDPVPASLYLVAADRQRASDALAAAIGASAARYGVQLDSVAAMPADPARPKAVAMSIAARGEHDQLLAWINDLELSAPAIHFGDWSLAPDEGAAPAPAAPVVAPSAVGEPYVPAGPGVRLAFAGTAVAIWDQAR